MSTSRHPLLLAAAAGHAILSLGHTSKGREQFQHPSLSTLPNALRTAVKAGWYEGSVFLLISAILNYKWSQTGLLDGPDKAVAGLLTSLLFGFGAKYYRGGDKATGVILWVVGVLQGLGAKGAAGL